MSIALAAGHIVPVCSGYMQNWRYGGRVGVGWREWGRVGVGVEGVG